MSDSSLPTLIGVDGCKAGWVAAVKPPNSDVGLKIFVSFQQLVASTPDDAMIAIDIPIGLPERIDGPGRIAEQAARKVLLRTSSVFSVPGRPAFDTDLGPFVTPEDRKAAYRIVCEAARRCSDPSKAVTQQTFGIMRKIKEVDATLRGRLDLCRRTVEGHPELAFRALNDEQEMAFPKKEVSGKGALERRAVLLACGLASDVLDRSLPSKVGRDDWIDACAMLVVAKRYKEGKARSFPDPPERDEHGLPIAIWA